MRIRTHLSPVLLTVLSIGLGATLQRVTQPEHLLCVMSRGSEEASLVEAVAETSRRVYAEVERQQAPRN